MYFLLLQTIPSASVLLLLVTGVLSSESAIIDISYHNDTTSDDIISIAFNNESLPQPLPQTGAQPRNYVAYIPVPISDDEDEEEGDEYYDDDEEYYDDEEYGGVSLRCEEKLRENVYTPEGPPHPVGTSPPLLCVQMYFTRIFEANATCNNMNHV